MDLGIDDKLALITGASKNLGRAIAVSLASEGVKTILVSRNMAELKDLISKLPGGNQRHIAIESNLQHDGAVDSLLEHLDKNHIFPDIVIHNLGGSLNVKSPYASVDDWLKVWHFNLGIAIKLNNFLLPKLIEKKWGRILHISTLSTKTNAGYPAYVTAKYALEGYVKTVSQNLSRHNVILNAIAPGLINIKERYYGKLELESPEKMNEYYDCYLPIRRMAECIEVSKVATFLCSTYSSYMPGALVAVDGGGR